MGLFKPQPPVALDPAFEAIAITSRDNDRRETMKAIGQNQAALRSLVQNGETPVGLAYFMGMFGGDNLAVITDRRSIAMKKGEIKEQLVHGDVARTRIFQTQNGKFIIHVVSHTAELDYSPDDPARFRHIVVFEVITPRIAQTICALIDARIGQGVMP